ncbi:CRISPR-associated endonuclease Cas2 [Acidianus brierleyi]|uniref:CRISPR-associated endoribonuclease Cas2 n=1 Tax=Acidianus brierleyi TaxID=41673 RepID=A0A2U9IGQ7_9CREN|nr:CRISPR-associated endonuclease Cas2 [Acidianus brierleyi]AWR95237.1 CRISPR-associated endonuclease Cas2 [Acidianus brierleyi]
MVRVIVIYDITDDTQRTKLSNELFKIGLSRIQKSAFSGDIDSQRFKDLTRICQDFIKSSNDVIHVVTLGIRDWERRIVLRGE